MRGAIHRSFSRALACAALIAALPAIRTASAQGRVTLSIGTTAALTTPGGSDIDNAATVATTVTATLTSCSKFPCTMFLKTNQASPTFAGTGTPVTSLDYCLTNCGTAANWHAVPNTTGDGDQIASLSTNTSTTFELRYRLGWTGSPFTPPGSYSLPIFVTLKD